MEMTTGSEIFLQTRAGSLGSWSLSQTYGHPEDVLRDQSISLAEKRALLASWASDARAVPGVPILRQLDDGSVVTLDEIMRALKALDGGREQLASRPHFDRRRKNRWTSWLPRGRRDDDNDPPPVPAYATPPRKSGGGGSMAWAEPALV